MEIKNSADSDAHPLDMAARLLLGRGALADLLGVSTAAIGNWKVRGVPIEKCVAIERATQGAVTRRHLRPDDYLDIWPELAPASAEPTQAATQTIANTAEPAAVKLVCRESEGVVIGPEQRTHAPRQYQDPGRDRRVHPDGVV